MIKSPLRYPGGKSKAIKKLAEYTQLEFSEYREPFLGGGSLFIYLRQLHPQKNFWINDLNVDVYSFWKAIQTNLKLLVTLVKEYKSYKHGRDLYLKLVSLDTTKLDLVERAARFFVLNRITFSGTTESGGYSERAFHERFTDSSVERVILIADLLDKKRVKITNKDYSELLNCSDNLRENEILIYLDPPYFSATSSKLYGKRGNLHSAFDHARFAENMQKTSLKWFISYDNCKFIRDKFSFACLEQWQLQYGMNNPNKNTCELGEELIISNF